MVRIDKDKCLGCGICENICPKGIEIEAGIAIIKNANIVLSFSRLTFTHQMIRLVLAEQIYRAFTIIKGKKYHY